MVWIEMDRKDQKSNNVQNLGTALRMLKTILGEDFMKLIKKSQKCADL